MTRRARRDCTHDAVDCTILCHGCECSNTYDSRYKYNSSSSVPSMCAARRRRLCLPPMVGAVGVTVLQPLRIDQEASKELACTNYSKEYILGNLLPKTLTGLCKPRKPLNNSRLVVVNCLCEFG